MAQLCLAREHIFELARWDPGYTRRVQRSAYHGVKAPATIRPRACLADSKVRELRGRDAVNER